MNAKVPRLRAGLRQLDRIVFSVAVLGAPDQEAFKHDRHGIN
jgi:hypothetical protein